MSLSASLFSLCQLQPELRKEPVPAREAGGGLLRTRRRQHGARQGHTCARYGALLHSLTPVCWPSASSPPRVCARSILMFVCVVCAVPLFTKDAFISQHLGNNDTHIHSSCLCFGLPVCCWLLTWLLCFRVCPLQCRRWCVCTSTSSTPAVSSHSSAHAPCCSIRPSRAAFCGLLVVTCVVSLCR